MSDKTKSILGNIFGVVNFVFLIFLMMGSTNEDISKAFAYYVIVSIPFMYSYIKKW